MESFKQTLLTKIAAIEDEGLLQLLNEDVDILMAAGNSDITANLSATELATLKKLASEPDDKDVVSWADYQKTTAQWRGK
ncbi:hypothetical protein [Parasediminibacterium sp. JCM 36343]|uniref:hypothetical protein n=1 Tax=Parasediminibacterium sp. JCM 36343 TaxID=3374279 RepID=UPI00397B688E